ncbi:MAG TPA: NAD(P)H-dependent oxidoreductase subunit E [Chloroflexota bacterium]
MSEQHDVSLSAELDRRTATYEQIKADLTPILERYRDVEGALLPILHEAQQRYGWISDACSQVIAESLRITPPQVYEVATYYHELSVNPPADVKVTVCAGPACRAEGGPRLQAALEEATGITAGDTSRDFKYAMTTSACLGVCFHPPAAAFNHDVVGRIRPEQVPALLAEAEQESHGHGDVPRPEGTRPGGSGRGGRATI